jgi:hypothetical protein
MLPGDEGMLRRIAERVRALGMTVPVIAFLEMHRPLRGVAHAGALVLEPSLRFVMGEARVSPFLRILERPESLDRLLQLLEDPTTDQSTKESPVPSAGAQHGRV